MTSEITGRSLLVSESGGILDFVRDGEVLASVAVPAGMVLAAPYLDLAPLGASVEVAEGLVVMQPRSGAGIQAFGEGSHDSGANPDFRPTSVSRMEREMRLTMNKMQAVTSRLEARERALASIERVPSPAPAPEPAADVQPAPADPGADAK